MKVLVLAEQIAGEITASTYHALTAAKIISSDITVAVSSETLAENITSQLLAELKRNQNYTHILAPATTFGKNILPRLAANLDVSMISDVIEIQSPDTFVRPVYAGNVHMRLSSLDEIKVLSIRPAAFPQAAAILPEKILYLENSAHAFQQAKLIKLESAVLTRPELSHARIIVSGGRGLQSAENFKLIEQLADCLNAAIGATRAAVDAGFVPNHFQVGQTGKIVAPELYIAIGISGAIQHTAGMKDSKVIIAINKDAQAPIFQMADYGLIGDLFELLPELIEKLKQCKKP